MHFAKFLSDLHFQISLWWYRAYTVLAPYNPPKPDFLVMHIIAPYAIK